MPTVDLGLVVGSNGQGVPTGGSAGQILAKNSSSNYDTGWVPMSAAAAAAFGIVETGNAASQTIAAGQYVIWKGVLYTADAAIASGTTLAASGGNKNLTAVSGGGLNAIKTSVDSLNTNFQSKVHFTFFQITSSGISATNNPLAIADNALQTNIFEIIYVRVSNNTGFVDSTPIPYTTYEIRHSIDTVTVNTIDYLTGQIKINCRTRNGSWEGWKTITAS